MRPGHLTPFPCNRAAAGLPLPIPGERTRRATSHVRPKAPRLRRPPPWVLRGPHWCLPIAWTYCSTEQFQGALDDVGDGEAVFLHVHLAWGGGPESVYPDDVALVADPAVPPHRAGGLNGKAFAHLGRQHLPPVFLGLTLEQLPRASGDKPHGRSTVRRALRDLVTAGLVSNIPGYGTTRRALGYRLTVQAHPLRGEGLLNSRARWIAVTMKCPAPIPLNS